MTSSFTTLTQPQFVTNWVDAWGASLEIEPNLPVGNIALATAEADANQATVLQYMAVVVIGFARASTSNGPDLDSWMADFGFDRLPAEFSTGQVTFSASAILTQPAFIPVGTIVQTPGGAIQYQVIGDSSLPTYNSATQQYTIPVGQQSTNVAVQSAVPGSTYNVQATQLSQINANVFGVSTVTNALAIQNGSNTETDPAFRARFVAYINSLSQATEEAIFEAIDSLESGLNIALYENVIAVGNPPSSFILATDNRIAYGNIVAIVADSAGNSPSGLLAQALVAVGNTVAFGIRYQVLPPAINVIVLTLNIRIGPAGVTDTVELNVQNALIAYINSLPIGSIIYYSEIIEQAMLADPNVIAVEPGSVTINTVANDFTQEPWELGQTTLENITVGTY